jgi:hypothetical protein
VVIDVEIDMENYDTIPRNCDREGAVTT